MGRREARAALDHRESVQIGQAEVLDLPDEDLDWLAENLSLGSSHPDPYVLVAGSRFRVYPTAEAARAALALLCYGVKVRGRPQSITELLKAGAFASRLPLARALLDTGRVRILRLSEFSWAPATSARAPPPPSAPPRGR